MVEPSMLRAASLALTLLLAGLAGCLQPEESAAEDATGAPGAGESPLFAGLGIAPVDEPPMAAQNATTGGGEPTGAPLNLSTAWWVARTQGTLEGGLTGFWWSVPPGAAVPYGWNEILEDDLSTVVLEVAPLVPEGKAGMVEAWGLLGFRETEDGFLPEAGELQIRTTAIAYDSVSEEPREALPSLDPTFVRLGLDLPEGARFGFVLVARTSEPMELGVAFRVLDHDPYTRDGAERPAASAAEFLAARGGVAPLVPNPTGTGVGFDLAGYADLTAGGFPAAPGRGTEVVAGNVEVDARVPRPVRALGPLSTSVRAPSAYDGGWALVEASYYGLGDGLTSVSASVDARGQTAQAEATTPEAWQALFVGADLTARAIALVIGEGEGPAAGAIDATHAGLIGLFRSVGIFKVEFGAPLSELLDGPEFRTSLSGGTGLGDATYAARGGDLVRVSPSGGELRFGGFAPALR